MLIKTNKEKEQTMAKNKKIHSIECSDKGYTWILKNGKVTKTWFFLWGEWKNNLEPNISESDLNAFGKLQEKICNKAFEC
tara:strand:+ start:212 stop:451 length:240 start_codon:yes stop_codon:yes gene_type:complete